MATLLQKRALKLVESGSTMKEVMIGAGYSKNTAIAPTKLTKSKGWIELLEKHLPDKLLAKRHKELLNKKEAIVVRDGKESRIELTNQPHTDVKSGLDMAYKLKHRYEADGITSNNLIIIQLPQEITSKHGFNISPSNDSKGSPSV